MNIMVRNIVIGLLALCVIVAVVIVVDLFGNKATQDTLKTLGVISAVKDDVNAYYAAVGTIPVDLQSEQFLSNGVVQMRNQWESYLGTRFTYERVGNVTYRVCAFLAAVLTEEVLTANGYEQFVFDRVGDTCFDIGAAQGVGEPVYRAVYP